MPPPSLGQFNSLAGCQSTRGCPVAKTPLRMGRQGGGGVVLERGSREASAAKFRMRFVVAVNVDSY